MQHVISTYVQHTHNQNEIKICKGNKKSKWKPVITFVLKCKIIYLNNNLLKSLEIFQFWDISVE